jgi:hypothetical protein
MRYNDLITTPAELFEAQLTPGQVKAIKLQINDYEAELRQLNRKKNELDDKFIYSDFPKELKDKVDAYVAAYTKAIDELKNKITQANTNPQFDNFIAGIKKNCSEIVSTYRSRGRIFYSGFKNTDQPALYGKPAAYLNLDDYRAARNGAEIQTLIETLYDSMSFENAVFATSDSYEASSDNRTPYIIFPRNGFKHFWPQEISMLGYPSSALYKLFDPDLIRDAWKVFVSDPKMFEELKKAGGGMRYPEEMHIGTGDGFMGRYTWEDQIRALDKMHEEGTLPDGWDRMISWTSWVSRESFNTIFDMKTDGLEQVLSYGHDCIINTSGIYAIHSKFKNPVFKALNIS